MTSRLTIKGLLDVRSSTDRWSRLNMLCRQLRRALQTHAQIDTMSRGRWQEKMDASTKADEVLSSLELAVSEEIDRVSSELLQVELQRRQRSDERGRKKETKHGT